MSSKLTIRTDIDVEALLVRRGGEGRLSQAEASRRYGVCVKIVSRWVGRFRLEGRAGMADRSSRPKHSPRRIAPEVETRIAALRHERLTAKHIARQTRVSPATVSRVLKRAGLSRLKDLAPAEPVVRYQYAEPGGLIHFDIKRLGRFDRVGHRITGDRTGQSNARGRRVGIRPCCHRRCLSHRPHRHFPQ